MFQNSNQKKEEEKRKRENTYRQTADRLDKWTLGKGAKCNLGNPSQFTPWLPPLQLTLSSPQLGELDTQWLISVGTPAMQRSIWSAPVSAKQLSPGLVGKVEVSLQEAGGEGPGLQRQVGAVVPSLPDGAIIPGQSPLQVGHGHGLLEVNHGIGV